MINLYTEQINVLQQAIGQQRVEAASLSTRLSDLVGREGEQNEDVARLFVELTQITHKLRLAEQHVLTATAQGFDQQPSPALIYDHWDMARDFYKAAADMVLSVCHEVNRLTLDLNGLKHDYFTNFLN